MQISFLPLLNTQNNTQNGKNNIYPYSCPSFKMKMGELKGIDQFVARKYKINPQPIKTLEAFQEHCKSLAEKILNKDFKGRQQETQVQRKAMIKDWYEYVVKENGAYSGAMLLMILGGITAGLKQSEDTLPPVLNKGVLANTVEQIRTNIPEKPDDNAVSFNKEYRLNLQKSMMSEEKVLDGDLNGWIVIPSKEHDTENFEANVDKLKMLSHDNWCTKSFNAEPYLRQGDFHVYMENGKPKLGVQFVGDKIQEIQGELNNSQIPIKYGDIAIEHIKSYKLTYDAKKEVHIFEKIKAIKSKFPDGIENASTQQILEALGITCKIDSDGLLIISHYGDCGFDYSYSDLGIDENRLFKDIKVIEEDADFSNSQVTNLGNLQSIGRDAYFNHSKITSLGNLQRIWRTAHFENSRVTDFGNLQSIDGNAIFDYSKITNLGNLETIGGCTNFSCSQITSLGKLQSIGGWVNFGESQITDLGNLQTIGEYVSFENSQVTKLGKLKSIGEEVYIKNSKLKPSDFNSIGVKGKIYQ